MNDVALLSAMFMVPKRRLSFVETVKPPGDILQTHYRLQTFMSMLESSGSKTEKQLKVLEFCARYGLIANTKMCNPPCVGQMSVVKSTSHAADGHRVRLII